MLGVSVFSTGVKERLNVGVGDKVNVGVISDPAAFWSNHDRHQTYAIARDGRQDDDDQDDAQARARFGRQVHAGYYKSSVFKRGKQLR